MPLLLMIVLITSTVYIGLESQRYASIVKRDQAVDKDLALITVSKISLAAVVGGICLDILVKRHGLFTILNLLLALLIFGGYAIMKKQHFRN